MPLVVLFPPLPEQLYSQMTQEGHKPDVITFGTLISACSHDGDVARATATWQEMESLGIKPNRVREGNPQPT